MSLQVILYFCSRSRPLVYFATKIDILVTIVECLSVKALSFDPIFDQNACLKQ